MESSWTGEHTFLWTHLQSFYLKLLPAHLYSSWCDVSVRIERMAHYIMDDFGDNNIMVLCVLKGGYKFCVDLVEFIKVLGRNSNKYLETRVEFIRLKSYLVGVLTQCHTRWTRFRARPLFWAFSLRDYCRSDNCWTCRICFSGSLVSWVFQGRVMTFSFPCLNPARNLCCKLFQCNFSHKKKKKKMQKKAPQNNSWVFPFCETIMQCWNN